MISTNYKDSRRVMVALTVLLAVFVLYVSTSLPDLGFGDAGDFALASYVLGVPHPPGFPLLTILGKLAMVIIPIGTIAWRMSLVSAASGAAACALVFLVVDRISGRIYPSIFAAAAFAVSPWLWTQSSIIEVYSLNVFFYLLILYLLLLWVQNNDIKYFYLTMAVAGLSLTNHLSILFYAVIPVICFFAYACLTKRIQVRQLLSGMVWFVLPLSAYVYLPIAASFDPVKNWGDPSTLTSFIDHLTMKSYQSFIEFIPARLWTRSLMSGIKSLVEQYWLLIPFGFYGLFKLPGVFRSYFFASLFISFTFGLTAARLQPSLHMFLIPAFASFAIVIGVGIAGIWKRIDAKKLAISALAGLMLVSIGYRALGSIRTVKDSDYLSVDFAKKILNGLPRGSVLISIEDYTKFPLEYIQNVYDYRPDVLIVSRYMLTQKSELENLRNAKLKGLSDYTTKINSVDLIYRLMVENPDRHFYLSHFVELDDRFDLVFEEPMFEIKPRSSNAEISIELRSYPKELDFRNKYQSETAGLGARNLINYLMAVGKFREADAIAAKMLSIDDDGSFYLRRRSFAAGRLRRPAQELDYAEKALKADPYDSANFSRLADYYNGRGAFAEAAKNLELFLDYTGPSDKLGIATARYKLVSIYLRQGEKKKAAYHATQLLKMTLNAKDRKKVEALLLQAQQG